MLLQKLNGWRAQKYAEYHHKQLNFQTSAFLYV